MILIGSECHRSRRCAVGSVSPSPYFKLDHCVRRTQPGDNHIGPCKGLASWSMKMHSCCVEFSHPSAMHAAIGAMSTMALIYPFFESPFDDAHGYLREKPLGNHTEGRVSLAQPMVVESAVSCTGTHRALHIHISVSWLILYPGTLLS